MPFVTCTRISVSDSSFLVQVIHRSHSDSLQVDSLRLRGRLSGSDSAPVTVTNFGASSTKNTLAWLESALPLRWPRFLKEIYQTRTLRAPIVSEVRHRETRDHCTTTLIQNLCNFEIHWGRSPALIRFQPITGKPSARLESYCQDARSFTALVVP